VPPRARLVVLLAAAAVASGCGSNVASSFSTGAVAHPIPPPGGVKVIADGGLFVSATIGISAATANVLSGIFIVGFLAAGNNLSPRLPPTMREDRAINLQDCSKPIENWSANLKCATPEELRELAEAQSE
jgi:hypothetical protein